MTESNSHDLVSVIMAAYNCESFINEAISSIASQTYERWELIIACDKSSDRTCEIASDWAKKDYRIKIFINDTPSGPTTARNLAISKSNGPYIAIMDADDISMPQRLEKQVAFLQSHRDILAVGSNAILIDDRGNNLGIKMKPRNEIDIAFTMILQDQFINSSMMIRRQAFDKAGGFRTKYSEDYDLFCRMLQIGKLTNINETLIKYRAHTASMSARDVHSATSLEISQRNLRPYLVIRDDQAKNLTDMMNGKHISILNTFLAIRTYKQLTNAFLRSNHVIGTDRASILDIFYNKRKAVIIALFRRLCHISLKHH